MACAVCGGNRQVTLKYIDVVNAHGILPTLKYSYCAFKDQFTDLFKYIGVNVRSEEDLPLLAGLYENQGDVNGMLKAPDGVTPIKFSVMDILGRIDTSKPVNTSCPIT